MKRRVILIIVVLVTGLFFAVPTVSAADRKKGLMVAPVRQEMTVEAGKTINGHIRVKNDTTGPLDVRLEVKQFAAENYTYEFSLQNLKKDWIRFESPMVTLQPDDDRDVVFTVDAPDNVGPGGHYFALLVTADMSDAGLGKVAQVVSQLYLTVAGDTIKSGSIRNAEVPSLVYDTKIPFTFDAENTGNTHYTAFFYGKLEGLLHNQPETGATHILLPDTIRRVGGSVQSPLLPGVYTLTYGYRTDYSDKVITDRATVLYVPPWSVVALVFLGLLSRWIWQKRRKK